MTNFTVHSFVVDICSTNDKANQLKLASSAVERRAQDNELSLQSSVTVRFYRVSALYNCLELILPLRSSKFPIAASSFSSASSCPLVPEFYHGRRQCCNRRQRCI